MRCNYKVILSLILNLWRSDFTWDILLKYPSDLAEQSPTGCCVEQKKGPVFVKDFKMNDSYLEQPSAKLEKYANETFDMLKNFYNDKEVSRTKLFDIYNKFRESRKDELDY